MRMDRMLGGVLAMMLAGAAQAQTPAPAPALAQGQPPQPVSERLKIGYLTDMSGPYSDVLGTGSLAAIKLAIEDVGGKALGSPIEIVSADNQNKPDLAASIARQWLDAEGVDVLVGGGASSSGLAMQEVARQKERVYVNTDSASSDFTGKACAPLSFQFIFDTYSLASSTGRALVKAGGDTWYFITVDYAFGHALERDTSKVVTDAGGKVLGSTRHPLGAADLSSYLLQAQSSHAKIIGLANALTDTANTLKQAREFGIMQGGQKFAALLMAITDVEAIGLPTAQGLVLSEAFYWDLNDKTRAWTKRFMAATGGRVPTQQQADAYAGALHYLKAVQAAGTKDARKVAAKMRETPVNDMYNDNVRIREDGRVMVAMHLEQVKAPEQSRYPHDDYTILATIPPDQAFRPLAESECPLVKK